MSLDSYKLTREYSYSNPRKEMLREKKQQVHSLYDFAMDREDDTFLNGNPFIKSPRIFDRKFVDNVHHKITVETILDEDFIECGDYLEYDGMVWLCLNSYSFHKLYCRATFMSCDWKIYWINANGELKSQYVIDQNSTQYNSGESGNSTMTLGAAQHMLKMQCNDDTILLDSPQKFAIDKNIKKPTCYKVTQNDNTSYNYGKGLCCITVSETQLNQETDKLITLEDGTQVWVCDYIETSTPTPPKPSNPDETADLWNMKIDCPNIEIKPTGYPKTLTATLYNTKTGEIIPDIVYEWNVQSSISEYLSYTINENILKLSLSKEYSSFGDDIFITCNSKYTGQTYTIKLITKGVF